MPYTTTASSVITRVLQSLQEPDTASPVFWSRAELLDLVWEALVDLNLISGYLQTEITITLNGNAMQAVPSGIAVLNVRSGNRTMQKYSVDDLDQRYPLWEDDSTTSTSFVQRWAAVGLTELITHKRMTTAGSNLSAVMLQLHPALTESTVLLIDDEYVDSLESYVFHVARLKEGGLEFQQSMDSYGQYVSMAGDLAKRTAWKSEPGWVQTPKAKLADAVPRPKP